ncbi:MAG: TRAP transporter small permease [Spirochaetaceae bacterium]|nr:TRAP transporter small permease [Spirochaetaceae bacterium]
MKRITQFFDVVYWIFMTTCKICFIAMVALTAYVVFNRYIVKSPLSWGEPVVLMFMVYMALVSAALAIRKDRHIRMQIIDFFMPRKVVAFFRGVAQVCIFFFGIFMIWNGCKFAVQAGRNLMTGVGIKSLWLYVAVPISGVAICLMEIERFINCIDRIKRGVMLEGGSIVEDAQKLVEEEAGEVE